MIPPKFDKCGEFVGDTADAWIKDPDSEFKLRGSIDRSGNWVKKPDLMDWQRIVVNDRIHCDKNRATKGTVEAWKDSNRVKFFEELCKTHQFVGMSLPQLEEFFGKITPERKKPGDVSEGSWSAMVELTPGARCAQSADYIRCSFDENMNVIECCKYCLGGPHFSFAFCDDD